MEVLLTSSTNTNLPPTLINPANLSTSYDMMLGINFVRNNIRDDLTIMASGLMSMNKLSLSLSMILILSQSALNYGGPPPLNYQKSNLIQWKENIKIFLMSSSNDLISDELEEEWLEPMLNLQKEPII